MSKAWNNMRAGLHALSEAGLRAVRTALVKRRYRENGNVDRRNDKRSGSDLRATERGLHRQGRHQNDAAISRADRQVAVRRTGNVRTGGAGLLAARRSARLR